jgi:hypothetical protein
MNHLTPLLHLAGAAAANSNSAVHRAVGDRDIDALGLKWTCTLPNSEGRLAAAIVSSVRALAAASTKQHRDEIAIALRHLVMAGRIPLPRPRSPQCLNPRRYRVEVDQ